LTEHKRAPVVALALSLDDQRSTWDAGSATRCVQSLAAPAPTVDQKSGGRRTGTQSRYEIDSLIANFLAWIINMI
jgi:hypothetical protein